MSSSHLDDVHPTLLHHTVNISTSLCGVMPRAYSQLQTALGLVDRPFDAVAADVLVDDVVCVDTSNIASVACSIFMKVLWVARTSLTGFTLVVNHISPKLSNKWTSRCESMFNRRMGYIYI